MCLPMQSNDTLLQSNLMYWQDADVLFIQSQKGSKPPEI